MSFEVLFRIGHWPLFAKSLVENRLKSIIFWPFFLALFGVYGCCLCIYVLYVSCSISTASRTSRTVKDSWLSGNMFYFWPMRANFAFTGAWILLFAQLLNDQFASDSNKIVRVPCWHVDKHFGTLNGFLGGWISPWGGLSLDLPLVKIWSENALIGHTRVFFLIDFTVTIGSFSKA